MKIEPSLLLLLLMTGAVLAAGQLYVTLSLVAACKNKEAPMTTPSASLRAVNPAGFSIPGISQAIVADNGRTLYMSGHVPMTPDGELLPPDLETQLNQVFENLDTTLRAAGATPSNLARITIYVRNFHADQLPVIRDARDRFIDTDQPPASALIGVAELFHPGVLVEVDAIAVLPTDA